MKRSFWYATKIWLLAVFAVPLLIGVYFLLWQLLDSRDPTLVWSNVLETYGLTLVFGGGGTVPVWLFFGMLVMGINELEVSVFQKKVFVQISSLILCMIAFGVFNYMLGNVGNLEIVPLSIPYFIMLTVGIWVFRLEKKSEQEFIFGIEEHLVE